MPDRSDMLILIPAFNEERALGAVLEEVARECPGADVLVVDDGSIDRTGAVARGRGARVLTLPHNLGVGGAVQAGFRYAREAGYRVVARIDADGQHPPSAIPRLRERLDRGDVDLVVASRFADASGAAGYQSTGVRKLGIAVVARALSAVCRQTVTDPTSGFFLINRPLLELFARHYPSDYPEPEALALLCRQGYRFAEVGVPFRARQAGQSSIGSLDALHYMIKVGLALVVDRLRPVDPRLQRARAVAE